MTTSSSTDFESQQACSVGIRSQTQPHSHRKTMSLPEVMADLWRRRGPVLVEESPLALASVSRTLGVWPDNKRGAPNVVLRSALFSGTNVRSIVSRVQLATNKNIKIMFTGARLNQKDLDYFLELLHLQRLQPLGRPIRFKGSLLLRLLGLGVGNDQYKELRQVITRLGANEIEIEIGEKMAFDGSLVEQFWKDEKTKEYLVLLNPQLVNLFDAGYTMIDKVQRQKLGKHMLAKALYGLYSTHADPHDMKVETICQLTGSTTKDSGKFRQLLRKAFTTLTDAGVMLNGTIDNNGKVKVSRVPTLSQQRHLAKKRRSRARIILNNERPT